MLLALLFLGKNNVTIFSDMFDVDVEVMMGNVTTTYVGPIKCTCQLALYSWQPAFTWLDDRLENIHKVTILVHEMRVIFP